MAALVSMVLVCKLVEPTCVLFLMLWIWWEWLWQFGQIVQLGHLTMGILVMMKKLGETALLGKFLKYWQSNWGPPSLMWILGTPCSEKICLMLYDGCSSHEYVMLLELGITYNSLQPRNNALYWAQISLLLTSPMSTLASHVAAVSPWGFLCIAHILHVVMIVLIPLGIPGQ